MQAIWKSRLELPGNENGVLWVRVESSREKVEKLIVTHGTGTTVPATTGAYIGTYQIYRGELVFHVFESE